MNQIRLKKLEEIVLGSEHFDAKKIVKEVLGDGVDLEHIGWDKLVDELVDKGYSKKSAENIAGYIKQKKYG